MHVFTAEVAAGSLLLLVAAAAASGYLMGSAGYWLSILRRQHPGRLSARLAIAFAAACIAMGYYSHALLPVVLVCAHSAWLFQRSRRIRHDKNRSLLAGIARMRQAADRPPAAQPTAWQQQET